MSCGESCVKIRPVDFDKKLDYYAEQIENYNKMITEYNELISDLKTKVIGEIETCGIPNLESAVNISSIQNLINNVETYKSNTLMKCSIYEEMIKVMETNKLNLIEEKNNYYASAWEEKCTPLPCDFESGGYISDKR